MPAKSTASSAVRSLTAPRLERPPPCVQARMSGPKMVRLTYAETKVTDHCSRNDDPKRRYWVMATENAITATRGTRFTRNAPMPSSVSMRTRAPAIASRAAATNRGATTFWKASVAVVPQARPKATPIASVQARMIAAMAGQRARRETR